MKSIKNIFICLVHENQDCIIDLVRNLQYLDPKSKIILYNGGTDKDLFHYFPFDRYNVTIHPNPKSLKWGWLHDFAIDCMEFAIANFDFDIITVVDSDQLGCGKNYSDFITSTYHNNPSLGMLGQVPIIIDENTKIDPAITAYKEKELWQPFLEKLPNGKNAFLYWTFWPSTAFTYKASIDLVNLFRTNSELNEILNQTKIWASEEIILPTLTIALGYTIKSNPCTYNYVKYRSKYSNLDIKIALETENSFWIHPVDRKINDVNRIAIRDFFENYTIKHKENKFDKFEISAHEIYQKTKHIEGWLEYDEMELLISSCVSIIKKKEFPIIVEIGSYCGKATTIMALTAKQINNSTKIIAIDHFMGRLGAEDMGIKQYPPSFEKFKKTLYEFQIENNVEVIKQTPHEVDFNQEIDILFIDGLHDYASVARDFYSFEKMVSYDGLIGFHDYCDHFPGVVAFVDELINSSIYQIFSIKSSLILIKKATVLEVVTVQNGLEKKEVEKYPLVSCIMPTYNRSSFITRAVNQFLQQDYPNKELIIIDDSDFSVAHLIPKSELINYSFQTNKLDIGTKRNIACKKANGEIIVHLDDDDCYSPDWLLKQVEFLIENKLEVTGLKQPYFYDITEQEMWQYIYPEEQKVWVYGATLCYTKKIWETNPFPIISSGEDNAFVWGAPIKKILAHNNINSYLGQIHNKNTSPKQTSDVRWNKLKNFKVVELLKQHNLQ